MGESGILFSRFDTFNLSEVFGVCNLGWVESVSLCFDTNNLPYKLGVV